MRDDNLAVEDRDDADAEGTTIFVDPAVAEAIAEVKCMLELPLERVCELSDAPLAHALETSGAPLILATDGHGGAGRCLRACRDIAAGETVLQENAVGWFVARSPGGDGLFCISTQEGTVITALPAWPALRTLRDTFTLAPAYVGRHDLAWELITSLEATEHAKLRGAWASVSSTPPGVSAFAPGGTANAIPPRAQLLAAIAQCNAFSAALPPDDSAWKRNLLWPTLCRMEEAGDRERLWDDEVPLSHVSALFPLAAQFNHACGPPLLRYTAAWSEGADVPSIAFVATADIPAGTELTHDYTGGAELTVHARRRKLLLSHRFICRCSVCATERQQDFQQLGGGNGATTLESEASVPGASATVEAGGHGSGPEGDDELTRHFPFGTGIDGQMHFFSSGGRYPRC